MEMPAAQPKRDRHLQRPGPYISPEAGHCPCRHPTGTGEQPVLRSAHPLPPRCERPSAGPRRARTGRTPEAPLTHDQSAALPMRAARSPCSHDRRKIPRLGVNGVGGIRAHGSPNGDNGFRGRCERPASPLVELSPELEGTSEGTKLGQNPRSPRAARDGARPGAAHSFAVVPKRYWEVRAALRNAGWEVLRQRGSHEIWGKPGENRAYRGGRQTQRHGSRRNAG
jgi:hypothetical protein